jgi:type II secretory pathway component HofQ
MMPAHFVRRGGLPRLSVAVLLAALMAGCGASRSYRQGAGAARTGDWDTAVMHYQHAVQQKPNRPDYRIALERAMLSASQVHLDQARVFEVRGQLEEALREYRRASEFDPPNRELAAKVTELERRIRDQAEAASRARSNIDQLREAARQIGPPPLFGLKNVLGAIRLSDTNVKTILNAIGLAAGINIQYDPQFPDRPFSINIENATLEDALNQVMLANGLFFKVLSPNSILVAQDTLQNRTKYEDQVIRTFYINNSDAAELSQTLNQIVRFGGQQVIPQITPVKSNNSIIVRAPVAVVDIVERIIEANDKPRAEVVVDVQILEVNRQRAKQFGVDLSSFAISGAFSPESDPRGTTTTTGGTTTGGDTLTARPFNANTITRGISTADFYLAVPQAVVRFLESDSETRTIAKPQLRGAEGSTLELNLGERIPVPATTFTPLAQGGANVNPLTSFNYESVGVNIKMTPKVTIDGDIILDLTVDNSALGPNILVAGQSLPSFTQRKVTTKLRLRDGESNLLAGLLRETDRKAMRGIPGILSIPILRSLFGANDNSTDQTDIVMLLTPRIIRTQELTAADLGPIYIGTQNYLSLGGSPPLFAQPEPNPATPPPTVLAPAPAAAPPATGISIPPPGSGPTPGTTTLPPVPPLPNSAPAVPQAPVTQPAPPAASVTNNAPAPAGTQAAGGQVTIAPPGTEFRVGQGPYTMPISIAGASRLSMVSLTVRYNPAVVRVRTVQEGSFMRTGGVNATFTQQVDAASGRVDIAIARTGDTTGVAGTGLLAALVFDAVASGTANLVVTGTAATPGGAPLALQFGPPVAVSVR